MSNIVTGATGIRKVKVHPDLWAEAGKVATQQGMTRSDALRGLMEAFIDPPAAEQD